MRFIGPTIPPQIVDAPRQAAPSPSPPAASLFPSPCLLHARCAPPPPPKHYHSPLLILIDRCALPPPPMKVLTRSRWTYTFPPQIDALLSPLSSEGPHPCFVGPSFNYTYTDKTVTVRGAASASFSACSALTRGLLNLKAPCKAPKVGELETHLPTLHIFTLVHMHACSRRARLTEPGRATATMHPFVPTISWPPSGTRP